MQILNEIILVEMDFSCNISTFMEKRGFLSSARNLLSKAKRKHNIYLPACRQVNQFGIFKPISIGLFPEKIRNPLLNNLFECFEKYAFI
jgi:hypothetical protein